MLTSKDKRRQLTINYMQFLYYKTIHTGKHTLAQPETNLLCFLLLMGRVPLSIAIKTQRKKKKQRVIICDVKGKNRRKCDKKTQLVKQLHL